MRSLQKIALLVALSAAAEDGIDIFRILLLRLSRCVQTLIEENIASFFEDVVFKHLDGVPFSSAVEQYLTRFLQDMKINIHVAEHAIRHDDVQSVSALQLCRAAGECFKFRHLILAVERENLQILRYLGSQDCLKNHNPRSGEFCWIARKVATTNPIGFEILDWAVETGYCDCGGVRFHSHAVFEVPT